MNNKSIIAILLGAVLMSSAPVLKRPNPDGFIPMFVDSSDKNSMLLNVRSISRLVPKEEYVEVTFTDGKVFEIHEPYQEFKDRIRTALK